MMYRTGGTLRHAKPRVNTFMAQIIELDDRRARFQIRDEGGDVIPAGRSWDESPDAIRSAFWEILARIVRIKKDEELDAGLDADGNPIRPARVRIGKYAGMTGPGLLPNRELSRTRRLFDVAVGSDHVTGYWRGPWSKIVGYHARGVSGTGRPIIKGGKLVGFIGIKGMTSGIVRNVVGMPDASIDWCISEARKEWRGLFDQYDDPPSGAPTRTRIELLSGVLRDMIRRNDRDSFRRDRRRAS